MKRRPTRRERNAWSRLAGMPWVAGLLVSCGSVPRTTIEGEDGSVLFPTGRLSWDVSSDDPVAAPEDGQGDVARTRSSIDFDLGYGSGEFTQQVRNGQVIQVGNVPFNGPAAVDVFVDLWNADLTGRLERRWPGGLGVGGRIGLRLTELELELREGTPVLNTTDSGDQTCLGLLAGVDTFYEPHERLRVHAAASFSWGHELSGIASGYEEVTTSTLEFGGSWAVGQHVRLMGGWRRFAYRADSVEDFFSDLDLVLAGPFLGLWISL